MIATTVVSTKPSYHWLVNASHTGLLYAILINPALALPRYTITDVGFAAYDINNKGQVAGFGVSDTTQGKTHAFRYTDGVGGVDLGVLPNHASDNIKAYGINELGQVVGTSGSGIGIRYTDGVGMEDLTTKNCTGYANVCSANFSEINEKGQVIGEWNSGSDTGYADMAVRITDGVGKEVYNVVAVQGDSESKGININNVGQSSGYSYTTNGVSVGYLAIREHAFRITDGIGMQHLGSLGGDINISAVYNSDGKGVSRAFGINDAGQVTGQSSTTSHRWHGFLYTDGVGMQDLGVLQGDDSSSGNVINDNGQIVGLSWNEKSGIKHAVLWTRPGCPEDLNLAAGVKDSGWVLTEARAINNSGQIVGFGKNPAGQSHGFRLTPVAAAGTTQCSVASTPGSSSTIDPTAWNTVTPLQSCITKACKVKLVKNRKILKSKATVAIKTKKAADKASARINQGSLDQRARAKANAAKKQVIAERARKQYDRAVVAVQRLHD